MGARRRHHARLRHRRLRRPRLRRAHQAHRPRRDDHAPRRGKLFIEWDCKRDHIWMTGPSELEFSGEFDPETGGVHPRRRIGGGRRKDEGRGVAAAAPTAHAPHLGERVWRTPPRRLAPPPHLTDGPSAHPPMPLESLTFGCRLNADNRGDGGARRRRPGVALLVNTCAVTGEAVRRRGRRSAARAASSRGEKSSSAAAPRRSTQKCLRQCPRSISSSAIPRSSPPLTLFAPIA